ncbi:MAG: hypothetical protein V1798_11070 [Pseudomonadota bacterium]
MRRHPSYDERLARELRSPRFAREFLMSLMEGKEGLDLVAALKHTIQRMGIKEFGRKARIHPKSISRMLSASSLPKLETLDDYLAPFGLKVRIVPVRRAAYGGESTVSAKSPDRLEDRPGRRIS